MWPCDGRKIELTQFDDQGDPTTGTTLAQKVATGGYAAVMGTAESGVTLARGAAPRSCVESVVPRFCERHTTVS